MEFLAECYENMLYSYGRSFVIQALAKYRKHRLAALLLEEALWDCQFDVRLRAVAQIWKPDRLGEIIADPYENGEIKEAATRSLVGGAPWSSN